MSNKNLIGKRVKKLPAQVVCISGGEAKLRTSPNRAKQLGYTVNLGGGRMARPSLNGKY